MALPGAMMTFFTPFTWRDGPTMVALLAPVPVAIPLWQSEQLKVPPEWVECRPVLVVGMLWQLLHVSAVVWFQIGSGRVPDAVVRPFVKLPWQ